MVSSDVSPVGQPTNKSQEEEEVLPKTQQETVKDETAVDDRQLGLLPPLFDFY